MPMPFDATLKALVERFQHDYEAMMGLNEFLPLSPLNVDLSTITAATDIALGHGEPPDRIVDINFQSGPDEDLEARVLLYNVLFHYRFRVPVHSVLVLLRPLADRQQCTGEFRYEGRGRKGKIDFKYEVVRLWEQPVRRFLEGGLGTLPLAPLCRLPKSVPAEKALGSVIRQVVDRLEREASPADRATLLTATYVLTGLRMPRQIVEQLFQGIQTMKESSTYQAIIDEGRVQALRSTLLRQGRKRFGPPTESAQSAIQAIDNLQKLEQLTERLLSASSWQKLLRDD
jgi:predicted transposase YdaD